MVLLNVALSSDKGAHSDHDTPKEKEPIDAAWWVLCLEAAKKAAQVKDEDLTGLSKQSVGEVAGRKVYVVDGAYVRWQDEGRNANFVYGGNGYAYPELIPKNEVWIDDVIVADELETARTVYHEVHEAHLMELEGLDYEAAHERCNGTDWLILDQARGVALSADKDKETDETLLQGGWGDYAPEPRTTVLERKPNKQYRIVRRGAKKARKKVLK